MNSMTFLCATRLLAAWMVLPFMYIGAIGVAYLGSYIAIVDPRSATYRQGVIC